MGCLSSALGGIPIIGSIAKGADEVFSRPGDLVNNPGQFFGDAAMGAAPFLAGPLAGIAGGASIPGWAGSLMGMGGGALAGGQGSGLGSGNLLSLASLIGSGPTGGGLWGGKGPFGSLLYGDPTLGGWGPISTNAYNTTAGYLNPMAQANIGGMNQALGMLPNFFNQASIAGGLGVIPGLPAPAGGTDPYSMLPYQQSQLNTQQGGIADAYRGAQQQQDASLAGRGLSNSSTQAASNAYLGAQRSNALAQNLAQFMEGSVRQPKLQTAMGLTQPGLGFLSAANQGAYQPADALTSLLGWRGLGHMPQLMAEMGGGGNQGVMRMLGQQGINPFQAFTGMMGGGRTPGMGGMGAGGGGISDASTFLGQGWNQPAGAAMGPAGGSWFDPSMLGLGGGGSPFDQIPYGP